MRFQTQRRLFLVAMAGLAAFLVWGMAGLPRFGTFAGAYSQFLNAHAVAERAATNVVAAITFDYRGFDTMGEEFILFAAVVGVAILLRAQRDEEEGSPSEEAEGRHAPAASNAVRALGLAMVGPIVVFGVYVVAHGHLSPGGGFQGGVVLATGALLVYLSGEYVTLRRVRPEPLIDAAESAGAGGYVAIGVLGLVMTGSFMENVLPLGRPGALLSAGPILPINTAVGLEVAAGFVLLLSEFLEQTLVLAPRGGGTAP